MASLPAIAYHEAFETRGRKCKGEYRTVARQLTAEQLGDEWLSALPAVSAYVRAEVKDRHDVEDVIQETGRAIVSSAARYDPERPFLQWAFGVAHKQILQYFRRAAKEKSVFSVEFVDALAVAYADLSPQLGGRRAALTDCLEKLKAHQRLAVEMYYRDDMSQSEIAEAFGMNKSAIGVLIHRTRLILKDCIHRRLSAKSEE